MSVFDRAPVVAIWEVTRACALACAHCRADAIPRRDPGELDTDEGRRLLDRLAVFEPPPLVVLTGGDPLRRPDLARLVAHGCERGLSVSVTPSGTGLGTEARLRELRSAGLARLAVSLDGASPARHDAFRGVRGSHRHTERLLERARALGLPLQVNTTVCRRTVGELPELAGQVEALGVELWALFFLIPIGRARADQALGALEIEPVLEWAAELAGRVPFGIKTTEAPQYHRVLHQRAATLRGPGPPPPGRPPRAGRAVTDGNGFLFIDHVGTISPSGFLPLPAGSLRVDDPVAVYREHPLFRALRDPGRLGGRCGRCEFRDLCGGSRARAWAASGDALAEDPGCPWQPRRTRPISGGSDAPAVPASPDAAAVTRALRGVLDPELGLSVVDLGLVYGIEIDGAVVRVTMTLTTPGCPLHEVMPRWVEAALRALPGVADVEIRLTFDPPWTPDRIRVGA